MSNREAQDLARWLADRSENHSVSKEVREAIYILSPTHVPLPNVDVNAVLSKVKSGPFAPSEEEEEELELKALQETLQSDLVPRLKFEDILNLVSSGPLAEVKEEAEVVPLFRKYKGPFIGALLAAAAALLLFIPSTEIFLSASQPSLQSEKQSARPMVLQEDVEEDLMVVGQSLEEEEAEIEEPPVRTKPRKKAPKKSRSKEMRSKSKKRSPSADAYSLQPESASVEKQRKSVELEREALAVDTLDTMRQIALSKIQIPPLNDEQSKRIARAEQDADLASLLRDADLRVSFEAAYRIGSDPSHIDEIENFLRIKGGDKSLRMRLYVRLGDLYREKGDVRRARESFQKAIRLP
ncbi:MAG: tetratricopeptide repeat protein [Myxococcota bacterium]|nr:tetratricopeptide repeat protein [Myxococcota bacterium]